MIIYDHPQGSAEWLASRAGVITASKFVEARKRLKSGPKKGGFTEAAEDYAFRVAVERISGAPLDEGFSTWAMKRGNELEPEARAWVEVKLGIFVDTAGFVTTDDKKFGASADGFIDKDGAPLIAITKAQAAALQARLGDAVIVDWAMRYGNPGIAARLKEGLETPNAYADRNEGDALGAIASAARKVEAASVRLPVKVCACAMATGNTKVSAHCANTRATPFWCAGYSVGVGCTCSSTSQMRAVSQYTSAPICSTGVLR